MSGSYPLPTEPEGIVAPLLKRFHSGKISAIMHPYDAEAVFIASNEGTITDHTEIALFERDLAVCLMVKATGSLQHLSPVINQAHRGGTLRLAFVSAVVSLVVSFAAAAAPIPLYNIYRAEEGFTNVGISIAVVAYAVGTIAALLGLGRLSNHLGRRLTAIISLSLALLGCVLLLNVHDIATLLVGRLLVCLGTGSASSSLTSYIVDAAPSRPEWLASVASSQGPMLGLTVGVIASGALVQVGPWPRDLIYLVCIGFLLLSATLIAISPETATPTPGAWRSLLPRVSVPARVRHLLPVAAAVFLATWATAGFYQAFVPALVEDQLHTRSPLMLGLVFAGYMILSVLGAPMGGRFTSAQAQRVGMIIFLAGMIGLCTAVTASTLVLFIIATIVAGAGQRIAISAAARGLLHGSTPAERAPIFSAMYLICYGGAAFPSLVSGQLSNTFSLPQITLGYGGLAPSQLCSLSSAHAIRIPVRREAAPATARTRPVHQTANALMRMVAGLAVTIGEEGCVVGWATIDQQFRRAPV